ncbi:MAG: cyclopropane-fatty-acyl-phospholipid synthase family protein, partial [Kangiella sp.]|nr:cyclopropane-fatty-acyl-phospholipid synthase family protein [Kangiella sp.]
EIGTGWGGFAIYAAKNYGCHVTTTTISEQQYQYAKKRVKEEGLESKITLLKQDYRNLKGQFDKLVSIEMIEAVGHQYLDTYLKQCSDLLKPKGMALIQAITIEDTRYKQALKSVDFIKRYIFPGSFIPCVSVIVDTAKKASDLRLINLEDFGDSYARTLNEWRKRFFSHLEEVKALGFNQTFIQMWDFYFCYCEGGFIEKAISDVHLLLAKPANKRPQWLALQS